MMSILNNMVMTCQVVRSDKAETIIPRRTRKDIMDAAHIRHMVQIRILLHYLESNIPKSKPDIEKDLGWIQSVTFNTTKRAEGLGYVLTSLNKRGTKLYTISALGREFLGKDHG